MASQHPGLLSALTLQPRMVTGGDCRCLDGYDNPAQQGIVTTPAWLIDSPLGLVHDDTWRMP